MKSSVFFRIARVFDSTFLSHSILHGLLLASFIVTACDSLPSNDHAMPIPDSWGPATYQVDAIFENGTTAYFAQVHTDEQLQYAAEPIPEADLPFRFYANTFEHFREIVINSPYPILPNWFQIHQPDCFEPSDTMTGIEFTVTTAREKDYLLIARLDSTYWECLKASMAPLRFSFQITDTYPVLPTPFYLRGFYDQHQELIYLKAQRDTAGTWHPIYDYQVFQDPGPNDFSMRISQHPQLGTGQSLLRIGSSMQLVPQSVWIGLAGECLDQADWEVHRNRLNDRFLLDVVIPDCYLDCLRDVADGFEFEVEFYQYIP